jgi:hypothetical protein
MKNNLITLTLIVGLVLQPGSHAADQSLASTIEVYVFPKAGQTDAEQATHEASCYEWAVENTGNDPFDLARQDQAAAEQAQDTAASAQQSTQGSGVRGAARGAAVGAVVGEIADDDAGKGAAWGAALGGVSSRRRSRAQAGQASQQADAQYQTQTQATEEDLENFKKAFSVCLEAQEYLVKY